LKRLKKILVLKNNDKNEKTEEEWNEEEILQVNAVNILSFLARGGMQSDGRKASEEQEHRIGVQLHNISNSKGGRPPRSPRTTKNESTANDRGSFIIDEFLINLVLSSFNIQKYYLMSTVLLSIAQRCILLRSKIAVAHHKGIRIMIRLLENTIFGHEYQTTIHEYAAHVLLNISKLRYFYFCIYYFNY
jgi:hypothetical protein